MVIINCSVCILSQFSQHMIMAAMSLILSAAGGIYLFANKNPEIFVQKGVADGEMV